MNKNVLFVLEAAANGRLPTRLACVHKPGEELIGGSFLAYFPTILDLIEDGYMRGEVVSKNEHGKPYHVHNLRITEAGRDRLKELRERKLSVRVLHWITRGLLFIISNVVSAGIGLVVGYFLGKRFGAVP
jgi:hypothetical protein